MRADGTTSSVAFTTTQHTPLRGTSDWTPVSVSFLVPTTATHIVVGVNPTVPMSPTIAGIRQGRDEVLERATGVVGGGIVP
jgi:hypothetical protein